MVHLELEDVRLEGHLRQPPDSDRLAIFVHGSGSSRHSPRNNHVAERLEKAGISSLLFDLLTETEDSSRATRFDIDLLTRRVLGAMDWVTGQPELSGLAVHLFGASTGAAAAIRAAAGRESAAAIRAAAVRGEGVRSVVSRGGRPDLAGDALGQLQVPCLLIVGGNDPEVLQMNRDAKSEMSAPSELRVVEGATHLFQESGALDTVANYATEWIQAH